MQHLRLLLIAVLFLVANRHAPYVEAADPALVAQAEAAIDKAAKFYREQVASHGGYVYHYSLDLSVHWGEGLATKDEIWVQPPGTPTVGLAFLAAYFATGDQTHLEAARAAGRALTYGQLKSGGWTNLVEFDPKSKRVGNYLRGQGSKKGNNFSTLDDGITPSALRFLMRLDERQKFADAELHAAVETGLAALLAAQFSNGAFPQGWTGPVLSPDGAAKASFPDYDWRTEGRVKNYWDMYNLNDGIAGQVVRTLLEAHSVYSDEKYKAAALKLGDFLVAAQLPAPQPAWAQQYDYNMRPIWARKFEPPAVTGWESQDVIETLMMLYSVSRDEKYLAPIPAALAYLKSSLLPDGRVARYYELQTNKPLYMNRTGETYFLTHDDTNLPDHYGWKQESRLGKIEAEYAELRAGKSPSNPWPMIEEEDVRRVVGSLDAEGRWTSTHGEERLVGQAKFKPGETYISSAVFSDNITLLSTYLVQAKLPQALR